MTGHPARDLADLERRARKRFGQHFLVAEDTARSIVRASRVGAGDRVVEIGPGLGMLTGRLLEAGPEVVAVEVDADLAAHLGARHPGLRLVQADARRVDWGALLPGAGWVCVANLPYNVGTRLTLAMLSAPRTFDRLVLMLQREVVDRMAAPAGDRARGSLSVAVQARARVRRLMRVPPGAFHPPPKVDSAVVELVLEPRLRAEEYDAFERAVRAGFRSPRKMLRRSLKTAYGPIAEAALDAAGVDATARPAELTHEEWQALAQALVGTAKP